MKAYRETLSLLERELEQQELQAPLNYDSAEKGIQLCRDALLTMRVRVIKKGFKTLRDECIFFKTIKPEVVGHLIFYLNIIQIELHRPRVAGKEKHSFYMDYISTLGNYFVEHREVYQYHIGHRTHLDMEYFTRNSNSTAWYPDSLTSLIDAQFTTPKDMVIAQIIGNTRTINYLRRKVSRNKKKLFCEGNKESNLKWTGNKVDLVELVYALHSSGIINYGRAELKEIAEAFETAFQISLGEYYRTFLEIRERKKRPIKFLDQLKTNLQKRMTDADR